MMKTKIPRLMIEGIRHIAECGFEHVYEEIIEEYGEKLKQDFMNQMKEKMKAHTEITIHTALDPALEDLTIKVIVDVKGEWK